MGYDVSHVLFPCATVALGYVQIWGETYTTDYWLSTLVKTNIVMPYCVFAIFGGWENAVQKNCKY